MKLVEDWRYIFKHAWSIRLMLLAGLLSGIEILLPFFADALPRSLFSVLVLVVVTAALITRLMAQKGMEKGRE